MYTKIIAKSNRVILCKIKCKEGKPINILDYNWIYDYIFKYELCKCEKINNCMWKKNFKI
jgi:hypothetical protein